MAVAVPPPRYEGHQSGACHAEEDGGHDHEHVDQLRHGGHDRPG
jgi:hypothetical protein